MCVNRLMMSWVEESMTKKTTHMTLGRLPNLTLRQAASVFMTVLALCGCSWSR
ncbi:hypothetical protein GSU3582 [Geobacter sulfurreducens PCA]|uniref:Uncharacterized protein n=1 Tax=Geobacter sulfurreducens (strain ATCC 51573 / DSM 12127 / PCA) TaxID=243231 RepID=I7FII1_GEOSL|nr:LOW QUALITY PROTEIN: hypothetical protein KN400_3489 [Geobacter sulfurreducens KN400]AFP20478.1 hypothetical protein GSU3582 [Geobacter sulfurreducens PCA]HBB68586.1 hypothetical protein [Geobacter sulfurreducens]HCD97402.1 hypothetical protein [Geobacter sulfurreducens]